MPDVTVWTMISGDVAGAIVALGGVPLLIGGVGGWFGGWLKDQQLARYKSELDREVLARKSELDATVERVRSELSQGVETHKLALRKQELLFGKRLEAASFLTDMIANVPFNAEDFVRQTPAAARKQLFIFLDARIAEFRGMYAAILPVELRLELAAVAKQSFALRRKVHEENFNLTNEEFMQEFSGPLLSRISKIEAEVIGLIIS